MDVGNNLGHDNTIKICNFPDTVPGRVIKTIKWMSCHSERSRNKRVNSFSLSLAADQVVIAEDEEDLSYIVRKLSNYDKAVLKVKVNRTK